MSSAEPRDWLRPLFDALIPEEDGMPTASAVGVADGQLDLGLRARPDLPRHLVRACALTEGLAPSKALRTLPALDPAAHAAVLETVAGGYYAHAQVRALLGYTGQQPVPVRPDDHPEYLAEGLLDRVVERGPIYRSAE
jgi:hypothetical protein